jgi:hypothetical protein
MAVAPAAVDGSASGCTLISAVLPCRQAGPAGATAARTPGSAASSRASRAGPAREGARISMGSSTPAGIPAACRVRRVCAAGAVVPSELAVGSPILMPAAAAPSAPRMATAATVAAHRCRTTSRAQAVQARLAVAARRRRGQSIGSPAVASSTGRRVSVTATLMTGTSMPPIPIERSAGTGSTISDSSPILGVQIRAHLGPGP